MSPVGTRRVLDAVKRAGEHERDGWAHPTVIAGRIGMSRSTAVRYCKELEAEGLLESTVMYGWRYSKSVRSIRFRVRKVED